MTRKRKQPGSGQSPSSVRPPGKAGEQEVWLLGFQGTGDYSYVETGEPLLYAGHVGLSFDQGQTIYGFTPLIEGLTPEEAITSLKRKTVYPGVVNDDTHIFHRAAQVDEERPELAHRCRVYLLRLPYSKRAFNRLRQAVLKEVTASATVPLADKWYKFPDPQRQQANCYNCATWPASLGLPIPEPTGQMKLYIRIMRKEGEVWQP